MVAHIIPRITLPLLATIMLKVRTGVPLSKVEKLIYDTEQTTDVFRTEAFRINLTHAIAEASGLSVEDLHTGIKVPNGGNFTEYKRGFEAGKRSHTAYRAGCHQGKADTKNAMKGYFTGEMPNAWFPEMLEKYGCKVVRIE